MDEEQTTQSSVASDSQKEEVISPTQKPIQGKRESKWKIIGLVILIVSISLPFTNMFLGKDVDIGKEYLISKNGVLEVSDNPYEDCTNHPEKITYDCKTRVKTCKCFGYSFFSGAVGIGNKCIGWKMICSESVSDGFSPPPN